IASAATLARMLAIRLPPASTQLALNGTPLASDGMAARPALRKGRGSSAPMRAATAGLVTTSSTGSDFAPSRFMATAVASTSTCPISSVPGAGRRWRYFGSPRGPKPWTRYWLMPRSSPSGPPIACCSIRANTGLGLSTRTVYASSLWWKNMCLLGRLTLKAFPGASGAAAGSAGGLETNPALASALRARAAVRLADGLGLGRATLTQPDREDDHP